MGIASYIGGDIALRVPGLRDGSDCLQQGLPRSSILFLYAQKKGQVNTSAEFNINDRASHF